MSIEKMFNESTSKYIELLNQFAKEGLSFDFADVQKVVDLAFNQTKEEPDKKQTTGKSSNEKTEEELVDIISTTARSIGSHLKKMSQHLYDDSYEPVHNDNITININIDDSNINLEKVIKEAFKKYEDYKPHLNPSSTAKETMDDIAKEWNAMPPQDKEAVISKLFPSSKEKSNKCCSETCDKNAKNFIGCEKNLLSLLEKKHQEISNKKQILLDAFEERCIPEYSNGGVSASGMQWLLLKYKRLEGKLSNTIDYIKDIERTELKLKGHPDYEELFGGKS